MNNYSENLQKRGTCDSFTKIRKSSSQLKVIEEDVIKKENFNMINLRKQNLKKLKERIDEKYSQDVSPD
jgi:hypothetical protein